jgi:hypothetical protein
MKENNEEINNDNHSYIDQKTASNLLAMEKYFVENQKIKFPILGAGRQKIDLVSKNHRELFCLDINCNNIDIERKTLQNRARTNIILARLDIGHPHRNPDNEFFPGTHLHLYKEGDDDSWAVKLPTCFNDCKSIEDYLACFMEYCKIISNQVIETELFNE